MTRPADEPLRALSQDRAQDAADAISTAFEQTGERIEQAFERAARSGELSFSRLTESILRDLARLTAERLIERPLNALFDKALGQIPLAGARADGGPVATGGAYLVGERGPEWFVPGTSGRVVASEPGPRPLTVHMHWPAGTDPDRVRPSSNRLARALARAVAKGSRYG